MNLLDRTPGDYEKSEQHLGGIGLLLSTVCLLYPFAVISITSFLIAARFGSWAYTGFTLSFLVALFLSVTALILSLRSKKRLLGIILATFAGVVNLLAFLSAGISG